MQFKRTVKYFVSGSDKYFDIFEAQIDAVEEARDSSNRKQIVVKAGDMTYKGLHNTKVWNYLNENLNKTAVIVLWKSPKGMHMLAYSWFIWEDYLKGDDSHEAIATDPDEENQLAEAFLYMWIDKTNDMKYIGKHKGTTTDGYKASGTIIQEHLEKRPEDFIRTILAYGTDEEMHHLETIMLLQLGAAKNHLYYNCSTNLKK